MCAIWMLLVLLQLGCFEVKAFSTFPNGIKPTTATEPQKKVSDGTQLSHNSHNTSSPSHDVILWTTASTNDSSECSFPDVHLPSNLKRVFLGILIGGMVCVVILGNLLVLTAVATFHELQTITNMFVASLACADLIMGVLVIPMGVPYVVNGKWMLGSFFCTLWVSIDVLSVTASIETLCIVALDRYVAITKPFSYAVMMTKTRARMVIAMIWITSASIAFIPIHLGWWKTDSHQAVCCYQSEYCCEFYPNEMYAILSSCISFYIPLFIMIFSYAIVFKEAIRHASAIDNHRGVFRRASMPGTNLPLWNKHHRRTVFTMGYIMGTFTLCWLPFFIVNITQALCKGCINNTLFTTLNWLGYFNSFLNPLIYCHSIQFRRAFKRIIMCTACVDGMAITKRASLTRNYGPKRSNSTSSSSRAGSVIHLVTSFFLSGGSSSSSLRRNRNKNSYSAATEYSVGANSEMNVSPRTSPVRNPKFNLGSPENDNLINNNNGVDQMRHLLQSKSVILDKSIEVNLEISLVGSNKDEGIFEKTSMQIPSRKYSMNSVNNIATTRRASYTIVVDAQNKQTHASRRPSPTTTKNSRAQSVTVMPAPRQGCIITTKSSPGRGEGCLRENKKRGCSVSFANSSFSSPAIKVTVPTAIEET